jgi:hypothetical protein
MNNQEDDLQPFETGLAGLAVTVTDDPETPIARSSNPPSQPRAVTPVPADDPGPARALPAATQMPDGWTLHTVASLVSDVAQNMYELPYILKKHKLTSQQYEILQGNEFFQRALEAEVITWQGANSIQKRLMLEAALAVEDALPTVAARMSSKTEPLGDIVALMKLFTEMAGVTGAKAAAAGPAAFGDRIKITINLGDDSLKREATPSTTPVKVIEHEVAHANG